MMSRSLSRRAFVRSGLTAGLAALGLRGPASAIAQGDAPTGKIAFVRDGDIWEWSSQDGTNRLIEDGRAIDPVWNPTGRLLLYARDGGSYSDLILANPSTGNRKRLTDNEGTAEKGSPDYVNGSSWAIDPFWSEADVVCYVSDVNSSFGEMTIWILDPANGSTYQAASDGGDQGSVENVSMDASATFCAYTVLAPGGLEGGTTYISMRSLDTGTTYPIIEGNHGAYDPAISPDADWIVASVRDESGTSDLWIFNRVEETLERLTDGEQASNATWSPDGRWIAYMRRVDTRFEIKAMQINRRTGERLGDARRLVEGDGIDATSGLSWAEL